MRPRTPVTCAHLLLVRSRPVTVVSPSPFMRLFAVALQALYAATPFRQAFMSLKLCDLRLSGAKYAPSMDNYWQGNSPSGEAYISEDDWQHSGLAATDDEKEAIDGSSRRAA